MRTILFILFLLAGYGDFAQSPDCPPRDSLWKRITALQYANSPQKEQVTELLGYLQFAGPCSFDKDSLFTYLLANISVHYFKQKEYVLAIQYLKKAVLQIYENAHNPGINVKSLAKIYFYLSIYYDSLGLVSERNEAADSCLAFEARYDNRYQYSSFLLTRRVKDLYYAGDYHLCAEYADFGESLIHKYYNRFDSLDYINYFINYKGNALFSLKQYGQAEIYLQSKKQEFSKEKNKIYVAGIYSMLGYLHKAKKEYETAIDYFQKALQSDLQTDDRNTAIDVLSQIGLIYAEDTFQPRKALYYYFQALNYVTASDSFPVLGNIANLYIKQKGYDSGFHYFRMAFNNVKPGLDEKGLVRNLKDYVNELTAKDIIKLVMDKGDACLAYYEETKTKKWLLDALEIYRSADQLLDKIKAEQSEMLSQLFWQADIKSLYEHAIRTCYLLHDPEVAFYFFERSRASLLNSQLKMQSRSRNEDMMKTAQLKRERLQLERDLSMAPAGSDKYIRIQKNLASNRQSFDRLGQIMKLENPLYYQSSIDTTVINISDTKKQMMAEKQALLELFEGEHAVYSLLISGEKLSLTEINKRDLDSSVKAFTGYISNPVLLNSHQPDYVHTAHHLYEIIFKGHDPGMERLIISPDGAYFPFEALVSSETPDNPRYFLFDHAISYAYSARYLLNEFGKNETAYSEDFLGVAPIRYAEKEFLDDLPGSDLSVNKIGSYFSNPTILIAAQATKDNFLRKFSAHRIIQLYTHASDSSDRKEPVIYFADSSLYLSELIPERKPFTRLIVLSACETGTGAVYAGEGVFSFNRGFAALGIPAALTNLWAVENKSTYRLTELFYKYIAEGLPTDVALQKAKIEFIESSSKGKTLPFYWAGTILAGKTELLTTSGYSLWALGVALIVVLGGLFFWLFRLQSRRKNNFDQKT